MKCAYILLCILLLFMLLSPIYFIINSNSKSSNNSNSNSGTKHIKGICYFDIDDTLTTAIDNPDDIVQTCLDNDYEVGIITASGRTLEHICDGDKAIQPWMSDILCKRFRETNGKMFNSLTRVAGKKDFPADYPYHKLRMGDYGYIKGFNMKYGRDTFYPHIKDNNVILFDDQQPVMDGVHRFNKDIKGNFQTECSNISCGNTQNLNKKIKYFFK